jgi:ATP-binding cassette, subfamily B, bacterial
MTAALTGCAWPLSRLGEALEALAHAAGMASERGPAASRFPADTGVDDQTLGVWITAVARHLGVEAGPHDVPYAETALFVHHAGPALFRLPGQGEPTFLALLTCRRRTAYIVGQDFAVHRLAVTDVTASLARALEARLSESTDALLGEAALPPRRRARVEAALLREYLGSTKVGVCWLLRLGPDAGLWRHVRQARLVRRFLAFVGSHAVHDLLWLLSWWIIGQAALDGRLDSGWLAAWALLLLTSVPFRLLANWSAGVLVLRAAGVLKQQLLVGALKLGPEEIRRQGVGQHLALVMESEAVEWLALSGGLLAVVAGVQLIMSGAVLATVAAWPHVLLLAVVVVLTVLGGVRYFTHRQGWTEARLRMSHDLVEAMLGHRTRVAQGARTNWHAGEDENLGCYLEQSRQLDRVSAALLSLIPRGWLVLGLIALAPSFVSGRESPAALAVTLGGVLLGAMALGRLTSGVSYLAGAVIAWTQVAPLVQAVRRAEPLGCPDVALASSPALVNTTRTPLLAARDLKFRYPARGEPVLRGCSLDISAGDRILLLGPSGGGKSTLVSLLTGLRVADSGRLLLRGFDLPTLGTDTWRRRVAAAPQFHENHIFTGTLAFNLLMSGRWPPHPDDLHEAEAVCRGLGLGDLLDRMPAGLFQMVGETGWQLSHGERSRLYIARALLQGADLVILDESFGQIDPESMLECLRYASDRARTLLLITQP